MQRRAVLGDRLPPPAEPLQGRAQVGAGGRVLRVNAHGGLVVPGGFFDVAALLQDDAKVVVGQGVCRRDLQGVLPQRSAVPPVVDLEPAQ